MSGLALPVQRRRSGLMMRFTSRVSRLKRLTKALARISQLDGSFSIVTLTKAGYADYTGETVAQRIERAADWCNANYRHFIYEEPGPAILAANETTSITSDIFGEKQDRVHAFHPGAERQDAGAASAAIYSSMRISAQGSNVNFASNDLSGRDCGCLYGCPGG